MEMIENPDRIVACSIGFLSDTGHRLICLHRISYFDKVATPSDDQPGEQTPIYAISFEMYENGISRALRLDYGDFVIDGKMSSLEVKPVKACK